MSLFEVETYESIDAWRAARRTGIGSSDAAALWDDVSPHASLTSVYESKVNGLEIDIDPKLAQWGREQEPAIARFYAWESGHQVIDPGAATLYRSTRWPWMVASLDRVIVEAGPAYGVLECKNRGGGSVRPWRESEGVPLDVLFQVYHQLAVTGWRKGVIGVSLGGIPPTFIAVERDEEWIEMHVEKTRELWERHIVPRVPPPVDGHPATTEALRRRFELEPGKIVQLGEEALRWHAQAEEANRIAKQAETLHEDATNHLKQLIGAAEQGKLPGKAGSYVYTPVAESTVTRKAHVRFGWRK